MINGANKSRLK